MAKLTPVSWPELVKRLKKLGLNGPYSGTKHPYMLKDSKVVLLPNPHHSGDISVDFLARLLRDAGISRESGFQFRDLISHHKTGSAKAC